MGPLGEKGVPTSSFCRKSWDWSLNSSQGGTKTQSQWSPADKKDKETQRGLSGQPHPHPLSPPHWGGQLRPDEADAAERTSVPMETAGVGEGSWAQLVSLQGDLGRRPRRLIVPGSPISLLTPLLACLGVLAGQGSFLLRAHRRLGHRFSANWACPAKDERGVITEPLCPMDLPATRDLQVTPGIFLAPPICHKIWLCFLHEPLLGFLGARERSTVKGIRTGVSGGAAGLLGPVTSCVATEGSCLSPRGLAPLPTSRNPLGLGCPEKPGPGESLPVDVG